MALRMRHWLEHKRLKYYQIRLNRGYVSRRGPGRGQASLLHFQEAATGFDIISSVRLPLSTGVLVLYVDGVSFTFMTPQWHVFANWVTFTVYAVRVS